MGEIKENLKHGYLTLDGALGTQLEELLKNDHDSENIQSHPLWSAKILIEQPELIQQVHHNYLKSGADVIITSTYQASKRGLIKFSPKINTDEDVNAVYKTSVNVAVEAKKQYLSETSEPKRKIYICGSVGPFGGYLSNGAEYTGDYSGHLNTVNDLKEFHRDIVEFYMEEERCDLIGFETVPNYQEIIQILNLMDEELSKGDKPFYLSMNFKDATHLCDGTEIESVFHGINHLLERSSRLESNLVAIGCNCVQLDIASDVLENIAKNNKTYDIPLIAYPNAGLKYDFKTGTYTVNSTDQDNWKKLCKKWAMNFNVRIIGACCGSNPDIIKLIHHTLKSWEPQHSDPEF